MSESPGSPNSFLLSSSFAPASPTMNEVPPSHKVKKYDRQLRLWGDHGQAALEGARVCLINATGTGTEALKNLVLPGIGFFCIVDSEIVKASDLGTNFFVNAQALGSLRAEVTTRLLLEMNSDVKGDYLERETLESLLEHRPTWFLSFSVVIVADIASEKLVLQLAGVLWDAKIPLVICRTYGLFGYIRIACKEHTIVESKPDSFVEDLHLDDPFLDLTALANSIELETLTKQQHSHVPWVILMLKFLEKWRTMHRSSPTEYKEKKKFQEFVDEGRFRNEDGMALEEENFDEASRAVVKTIGAPKVPAVVLKLFGDPACETMTSSSSKFWIIVRAIRDFVREEGAGHLPLSGSLPDMTSDTESFVRLQNVFREKADADAQAVYSHVQRICSYIGVSRDFVKPVDVKYYSRNAAFLRCFRTSRIADEYQSKTGVSAALRGSLVDDAEFRCSVWYVMLRSVDGFFMESSRMPGSDDNSLEADTYQLKSHASKFLKSALLSQEFLGGLTDEVLHKFCQEATKYGGEQVHSVAAFIGGCVGQEVIKLLTGQYVPLNNTLLYDATASVTTTFTM